ncbi:S8 family peptidase [Acetivibrio cellulolyticus]|uniref:S8 family peptidase n=1 Tax=Acetivibrio cellulolyticus TaxID=35830 RepID=UPI0001E2D957|nr:S8 family peptidase [Acetivibrio cellulolyticus]
MLKKAISAVTIACVLTSALSFNVLANSTTAAHNNKRFDKAISMNSTNPRKPGQLIVKYKNNATLKANKSNIIRNNGKILKSDKSGLALVQVDESKLSEKIEAFEQNSSVEYVAPNYIRKALDFPEDAPNDPRYEEQWGLKNINAPEAWATLGDTSSLNEVVVAVIDTGLDSMHEDLKDRVTAGYDFVDMDNDPSPGPVDEEHASHVAGIIAASTDNGIGVAGTAGKAPVKIMPLRVLEAGSGDDFTIAQAINYAADNGARVINMSLGGYGDSPVLTEACNYAFSKNVAVVAAAGNSAMDAADFSPASIPGVITVAATDIENNPAYFSNYGSTVELAAPGVNVLSTLPNNTYEFYDGTSMATPFVASACALLISKNPSLSLIEVEQYLTDSAQDLGAAGKDEKFGYGLLDLNKALNTTEITPRLDIMNLSDNSTVFDLLEIQTRFTYPEKVVTTELSVDDTVVSSVYNDSNNMFTNFELDTYNFTDGNHTLKVTAYDNENQTYSKEMNFNIRNNVYTGLRVKLTQDGVPVSGGYIEVWNKYTQNGETYYNYVYSGSTSKTGVAVIPGASAPNGNDYVIIANYAFDNGGEELAYASLVGEATAPGIVELDGKDLLPVTVDTGISSDFQYCNAYYKLPGSNQTFPFYFPQVTSDGSFDAYLNPGTYSFEAIGLNIDDEKQAISSEEPIYMISTKDVEIDSGNFYVPMDSDVEDLSKVDLTYKDIHGFVPNEAIISVGQTDSNFLNGFMFEDIKNVPDMYLTPGTYSYSYDIYGQKDAQKAYMGIQGNTVDLEANSENTITVGGTFTGKIGLDKTKFVPGETPNINASVTDSQGNRLMYMDYIYDDPFAYLTSKNILKYKTGANKVAFKAADTAFKAMEDPSEPVIPEEPVVIEYKSPASLQLLDSKNNVLITEGQYNLDWLYFSLPQNLVTGSYKLKLSVELPYLIEAETAFSVDRVIKNNAVKFTLELPGKIKATNAFVEAINTTTGESFSSNGGELLNGELFIALPKGNYKFIVTSGTADNKPVVYIKDGKSPANYTLAASTLQNIKFASKDETGNVLDQPCYYYFTIPTSTQAYQYLIGYADIGVVMNDAYLTKGTYNFGTDIFNPETYYSERILFNKNVAVGLKTNTAQTIEFNSANLTEVSLDKNSELPYIYGTISDPKTGFAGTLIVPKGGSVKVSKGIYTLDTMIDKTEYENTYSYQMTTQKDFSGATTCLNFGTDFSITLTPSKSIYKAGETLKTTNVIADKYGNRVVNIYGSSLWEYFSENLKASKGHLALRKDNGQLKVYDLDKSDYVEVPYYDLRAPLMSITDSFGDVIYSEKSPNFYTQAQIKLNPEWAESGDYKLEMTIDIDADGNQSAETSFKVK